MKASRLSVLALLVATLVGCKQKEPSQQAAPASANPASPAPQETADASVKVAAPYGRNTDDLDQILKRRNLRALVVINPVGFFYDNGHPMGANYEALRELETYINKKENTKALKVKVTFLPVRPDQLEAALAQGVGDVIAYAVVVTPERQKKVAFTVPVISDLKQVVVSGPNFGTFKTLDDLGGKQLYVNPLTENYQILQQMNQQRQASGKPMIKVNASDPNLTEEDIIQMVNAGLVPATVANLTKANLLAQVLPNLTVHTDPVIASGQQGAWVVRKNNPQLKQLLDEFITPRAVGTSFGNTLLRRYLLNAKWIKNSTSSEEMKKFGSLSAVFKKYAGQYDFDYLMIMAQGYQESLLNQSARNSVHVGIMQVNPKLAAADPINVKNVSTAENNILAGVRMLRDIEQRYLDDPNLKNPDKTMMVFASYNAGPTRIARLRKEAAQRGLDPNKWFNNVELVVAQEIGQETVNYVSNIYKYYVAYKLALAQTSQSSGDKSGN